DLAPQGRGKRFPLIVDTGATWSVITPLMARELGVRVRRVKQDPYRRATVLGRDLQFYVDTQSSDTGSKTGWEYGLLGGQFLAAYVVEFDFDACAERVPRAPARSGLGSVVPTHEAQGHKPVPAGPNPILDGVAQQSEAWLAVVAQSHIHPAVSVEVEHRCGHAVATIVEPGDPGHSLELPYTGAPEEDAEPLEQRYLRLAAEFENHKKRMERERAKVLAYANEVLLEKLLPVVDNLERALAAATPDAGHDGLVAGVELTLRELKEFLRREGVDPIEAIGGPFDPTIHEAVSTQPSSEVPEGVVINQIEKGYRFKERILRPAKVIVSSGPPS
ncbi:MAG: nucleotide exchange factor GrpE, partial [Nitrospinae bacterium]|nr:nucleotide exchange factor GrpE [Nitrospinota bacterium]